MITEASNRSAYEIFNIESADGRMTVDLRDGVIAFAYFENILTPSVTATAIISNTGGNIVGKDGTAQGLYNGLPLRGGERVSIKIAANCETNKSLDFSEDETKHFVVASITNVLVDAEKESFTLNLVTREAFTNQTARVGKKYPTSQAISETVSDILITYLKTKRIGIIDKTINNYGFIGNLKKPFHTINWLATKSVAYDGTQKSDSSAGFLFFQTQDGFNFRSIDNLIKGKPFGKEYVYTPGVIKENDPNRNFKIIKYSVDRNQDLMAKMMRGAFSSERYYINPVTFEPIIKQFKASDYTGRGGVNTLGDTLHLPSIGDEGNLGDLPTRIFVGMLDVGTVEKDVTDKGWDDAATRNADPMKTHAQTMMRYNQLMTQTITITVPLNTNLTAGSLIKCNFPKIDREIRKEEDPESSGLYMIKEMSHFFDTKSSFTRMALTRDSSGKK